ncbi:thermonuclease family protein [Bacillus sp. S/N-304-OC-R1]|uniref:thermonuclease family protein n=1 Tax=Bacillus sp. S/N-304-OC-R1 TaxID=2758034 RepID=UPI001C8D0389|nr:thermonuclease family protein [Bacillus sp. S/N-304-OC-R1]MBY0120359.1 thermonuclease family protein [Bacillus sp. S/N-304-OC-R1]
MLKILHKKMFIFTLCLLLFLLNTAVGATETEIVANNFTEEIMLGEKYPAELMKCIDGKNAEFEINGQVYKTKFLYIDTPESTNEIKPFGKEASVFTCNFLMSGKITIETDGETLFDQDGNLLAWIWVGDQLHQEAITRAGFVERLYDDGDYLYEDQVIEAMESAKKLSKGIFASKETFYPNTYDETMYNHSFDANVVNEEEIIEKMRKSSSENIMEPDKISNKTESRSSSSNVITGFIILCLLVLIVKRRNKSRK